MIPIGDVQLLDSDQIIKVQWVTREDWIGYPLSKDYVSPDFYELQCCEPPCLCIKEQKKWPADIVNTSYQTW